jgi:hypothetical protein
MSCLEAPSTQEKSMTRRLAVHVPVSLLIFLLPMKIAAAADWMLRVETSSRACHVQLRTAAPLGRDFKGPFPSRQAACAEASNQYDSTLSNQGKCWTYGGGTIDGCGQEHITLPPTH